MGDSTADLFDEVGWDEVERNVERIREWEASGLRLLLYPPANRDLATRVLQHGALVSQFCPYAPPTRVTFLLRSHVLQEEWEQRYAQRPGTTVVESLDEFLNPPVQLSLY